MYNKKLLIETLKSLDKAKKPVKEKDIDYNSKKGYRKDSPFKNKKSMDIFTENGIIDMSQTDRDILANGRILPAYSGLHQFDTNVVTEIPLQEAKKGGSKKYSKSLLATNRLFAKNPLFKKKNYKSKIYDPSAMYFQGGGVPYNTSGPAQVDKESEYDLDAMNAMMKARFAYAQMHGNPAAQRMVNAPDQPYVYTGQEYDRDFNIPVGAPEGSIGTHYMASFGNYAVPFIQKGPAGLYFNELPTPKDREAIRFENEEDAGYFGGHYKDIAPDPSYRLEEEDGGYIEADLTPEEMQLVKGIREFVYGGELPEAQFGKELKKNLSLTYSPFESGMFTNAMREDALEDPSFTFGVRKENLFPRWSKENDVRSALAAEVQVPYAMNQAPGVKGQWTTVYEDPRGFNVLGQLEGGYRPDYGVNASMFGYPYWEGSNVGKERWLNAEKYYPGAVRFGIGPQAGWSYRSKPVETVDGVMVDDPRTTKAAGSIEYGARGFLEYSPTDWLKLKLDAQAMADPVSKKLTQEWEKETGVPQDERVRFRLKPGVQLTATVPFNALQNKKAAKRRLVEKKLKEDLETLNQEKEQREKLDKETLLKYTPKLQDGGITLELTPEEIQQYRDGGYIVEEVVDPSIPRLNRQQTGGATNYKVGDEIDEATMLELKKQGYTFERI